MNSNKTAPPLSKDLLDKVESLQSTAEYIVALADVVDLQMANLRKSIRDYPGHMLADVGDWQDMGTILSLLRSQGEIVKDTTLELEMARSSAYRADRAAA